MLERLSAPVDQVSPAGRSRPAGRPRCRPADRRGWGWGFEDQFAVADVERAQPLVDDLPRVAQRRRGVALRHRQSTCSVVADGDEIVLCGGIVCPACCSYCLMSVRYSACRRQQALEPASVHEASAAALPERSPGQTRNVATACVGTLALITPSLLASECFHRSRTV